VADYFREYEIPIVQLAHEAYQLDAVRTSPRTLVHLPEGQNGYSETYFAFTIVPTHDAAGRVTGVVIYAADQTLQRANEVEEELQKLKLIFGNIDTTLLALYDAQSTRLLMASPRYLDCVAQVRQLNRDELIGCKWEELNVLASAEEAVRLFKNVLESRSPLRVPEVHLNPPANEQESIWSYTFIPIANMSNEDVVDFVLISAVEVTEQVKTRVEIERLNQLKDDFLSLASHELRTPLTALLGNAQLLERHLKRQGTETTSEQARHVLDNVIYQVHRLSQLIDEMVDMTRIRGDVLELHTHENVNMVALVRRVIEQFANTANRALKLESSEESITGNWDEARLEQVLNNLVSNAIKYSPSDKPVVIGVQQQPAEVIVWVRDEGRGISEEDLPHIFDRFYRSNNGNDEQVEGLGLGLYIAHEIIVQQRGRMWVESKPGEGSTFYFSLPIRV
jgi:signal transduction histidine kinase